MLMQNCPAKFANWTTLRQIVKKSKVGLFNNFWMLIHNWRKITVPHEDTSVNVFLSPERTLPLQICVWEWNGKMMSSNEQTEERVSRGFIQRSVLTAPLIPATCSNTQASINNSSGPRSLSPWVSRSRGSRCVPASQRLSLLRRFPRSLASSKR